MEDKTITALHEAGHAVAFVRLWQVGRVSRRVTIVNDDEMLGRHSVEDLVFKVASNTDDSAVQNAEFEKEAIYCFAGYAAVLAAGHSDDTALDGCTTDFDQARQCTETPLEIIKQQAVALMHLPENIAAVRRLADELIHRQTISGDEIDMLVDVSDGSMSENDYQRYLALKAD